MRRVVFAIFLAAITGMAFTPGAAFAGPGAMWPVNSLDGGAQSQFRDADELLSACDLKADGKRAIATAVWTGSAGVVNRVETADSDGANGNCAPALDLDINDGIEVRIGACVQDGPNGFRKHCNYIKAKA
ncbi:MAG: hypothetical protein ACRDTG_06015 [Pseudonocardiaceae bacterium]